MIETRVVRVTPDGAKKYLQLNRNNRNIRQTHVDYFCKLLRDGEFKTTHQGIAIDTQGNLIDGQHRLVAIVQSGISALVNVSVGLSPDAYVGIDNGIGKSNFDILKHTQDGDSTYTKGTVQIATFLCRFLWKSAKKATAQSIKDVISKVGVNLLAIEMTCNTAARTFSQAPIRLAAAIHGSYDSRSLDQYKALVMADVESMVPSIIGFFRSMSTPVGARSNSTSQNDIFRMALYSFDPRNFRLKNKAKRSYGLKECQEAVDLWLSGENPSEVVAAFLPNSREDINEDVSDA